MSRPWWLVPKRQGQHAWPAPGPWATLSIVVVSTWSILPENTLAANGVPVAALDPSVESWLACVAIEDKSLLDCMSSISSDMTGSDRRRCEQSWASKKVTGSGLTPATAKISLEPGLKAL